MPLPLIPLPRPTPSEKDPCPPELRYEVNELVNVTRRNRVQGHSARFTKEPLLEEEKRLALSDSLNFQVVEQLYKKEKEDVAKEGPDNEDIRRGYVTPQYRLHTLKSEATLLHVTGAFGEEALSEGEEGYEIPEVGDIAYTNGFIWTSTNPRWIWRGNGGQYTRCRIDVPAGTQVIVDRAPVSGSLNSCQADNGKISYFPDVLLSAGKFTVVAVSKFKAGGGEGYGELTPEVARRVGLEGCGEDAVYVDVHLCLEDSMHLPETIKELREKWSGFAWIRDT